MGRKAHKNDSLPGSLDMLILRTLSLRDLHGYGIVQFIQQSSDNELLVEEGSLYPALQRLELNGWIEGVWGVTSNNRRARIYKITAAATMLVIRIRSGRYEHVSDVLLLGFAGFAIPPRNPLEMVDAFEADNFRVCQQADVRRLFNATNKIFRHCVSEARTSDEHVHVLCALGQKNSGLARGISTANHCDFLSATQLRLNESCPVINAGSFKAGQIFNRQLAVFGSGSDDDRARWDPGGIFHLDLTRPAVTG